MVWKLSLIHIFAQMQQEESDIPNAIKRLQSNEAYLETIRRDMKYLEREKGEWQLYQDVYKRQPKDDPVIFSV